MRRHKMVIVVLLVATFLVGCAETNNCSDSTNTKPVVAVSENWSFISFRDMWGYPSDSDNVEAIGNAILQWEQANLDRKIVDIDIIYQPGAYLNRETVLGISIYSEKMP